MVKGVKAFNKGLICRDFQFKEGETFQIDGAPKACNRGFHFCENPLDVLDYYPLVDREGNVSDFAVVEALGEVDREENKIATNKLHISGKLDLPGFIKASIDFIWNKYNSEKDSADPTEIDSGNHARLASSGNHAQLASSGNHAQLASSGNHARLASSGNHAQLASSGNHAQLASSGYGARLASSGNHAQLASSGYGARLASSGDSAQLASSGDSARLASSGDSAQLASSGDSARLASSGDSARLASSGNHARLASSGDSARLDLQGEHSVGAAIGRGDNMIRGKVGSWITLAEWVYDSSIGKSKPVCVKSARIDGEILKEDTWYELRDGEFREVLSR